MLAVNEPEDLFRILKDPNAMLPILDFMGFSSADAAFEECLAAFFVLVRLAWTIVKSCGYSKYRNNELLVQFVIRSWSLMFYVCKSLETRKDKHIALDWIFFAHSQLGEVGICARDDAFLLKLLIRHCVAAKGGESMSELYQGFCCMYGVTNTVDPNSVLLEHNSQLRDLDLAAAAEVFAPLSAFVMDKLATRNIKAITNDIRDTFESISEHFVEPPFTNSEVAFNRKIISQFLQSGIRGKQVRPLGTLELVPAKTPYLGVYKSLFFIRGKFACLQKRAIIGIKTKKSFENLELAVDEFLFNLYVNPFSVTAWLTAADAFCSLSYEYLSWNANDIISNLELIRNYQRQSFHCYEQAQSLLHHREFTSFNDGQFETDAPISEQAMFIWGNYGFLCYSMIAAPMSCLSVKSNELKGLGLWKSRYEDLIGDGRGGGGVAAAGVGGSGGDGFAAEVQGKALLVSRGTAAFKRAWKKDPEDWRYPFMLAKMAILAGNGTGGGGGGGGVSSPELVIGYFEKALPLVPENSGTKEQETILDVQYGLVSYLCKALSARTLEGDYVMQVLARNSLNKDGSLTPLEFDDVEGGDESVLAYQAILRELAYMKHFDKKKWQHKPFWKSYWIYKNIFNDVEKAKSELINIFQLRSNARSFINFWKPEFERPGRHYVYIHKYTIALISILRESKDLESLRHLVRKSQKAFDVLLYPRCRFGKPDLMQ
ncbi:hypothetical protein BDR26DRAFT_201086 [Obelidium mucronatum]|nr:hypothetical protein BDR26DRAFT_201086 [Obelidium mucronatum]